jgi:PilZ domain-containing protein
VEHLRKGSGLSGDPFVRRAGLSFKGDPMTEPVKCRRRKIGAARFEVHMDVQFVGLTPQGLEFEEIGVVRNLSMRGALIETHALVTTDDRLTLFLTLPNQIDLLEIPGVAVRWVQGHQLGVEFLKLDTETSRQLMRYLSGIHNAARAQGEVTHTR